MAIWISVLEGPRPERAAPILVTDDPGVVALVRRAIDRRFRPKPAQAK